MDPRILAVALFTITLGACGQQDETAQQEGETMMEKADQMAESTAQTMDQAAEDTADMAGDAMDQAKETTADVVESGQEMGQQAMESTSEAMDTAQEKTAEAVAAVTPAGGDMSDTALGEKIYKANCVACHGTGAAGAPKLDDAANWAPRLEQGMDMLYKHSIEGFQGSKGMMPPKGGFMQLSDDEVKAAVRYMVSQAS